MDDLQVAPPKRQLFGPGQQPFTTGDGHLAFALYLAFVQFADDATWCINYYTRDMLRSLGYKDVSPREAAKLAVKANQKGVVKFLFAPIKKRLLTIFTEQEKMMQEGEGNARDKFKALLDDYKSGARDYEDAAIRIACLLLKSRNQFMGAWREQDPLIRIDDEKSEKQSRPDGSIVMNHGGFKFISASASEKTTRQIEI